MLGLKGGVSAKRERPMGDARRRVGAWPSRWAWLKERALVAGGGVAIRAGAHWRERAEGGVANGVGVALMLRSLVGMG